MKIFKRAIHALWIMVAIAAICLGMLTAYNNMKPYESKEHLPVGSFQYYDRNFSINEDLTVTITPGDCDVFVCLIPYSDDPEWLSRSWKSMETDFVYQKFLPAKSTAQFKLEIEHGTGGGEYNNVYTLIVGKSGDFSTANFSIDSHN